MQPTSALHWFAKCGFGAGLLLLVCGVATAWFGNGLQLPSTTTRDGTLITLNRYVRQPIPDVVLVGSSLTFRLKEEYFTAPRLRNLALAGGSQVWMPVATMNLFCRLGALSRKERLAAFDAGADGTLLGEGIGVVVLKRLEDAVADGDRVYAVVRGVGVSSDGRGMGVMAPRIEGEVAFVLGADLNLAAPTDADVVAATDSVVAALEIIDSRIAGWDITLIDTVADNASAAMYVLGSAVRPLDLDLASCAMTMRRNGTEVSAGLGSACLGSPVRAVAWLAATAYALGAPLRAGDVVLSGALGPVVDVHAGDRLEAEVDGLGAVSVTFGSNS